MNYYICKYNRKEESLFKLDPEVAEIKSKQTLLILHILRNRILSETAENYHLFFNVYIFPNQASYLHLGHFYQEMRQL